MDDPTEALAQARRRIRMLEEELRRGAEERVEEAFRIQESSLSAFIAQVPAAVAMLDRHLRYLSVSRRWMEYYAAGRNSIIGECLYDVFPLVDEKLKILHQRALAGEMLRSEEDTYQRTDGVIEWVWWEMLPWRQIDGSIGGIIILSEIITEQKLIEADLRKSEERYRELSERMSDLEWEVNERVVITYMSPRVRDLFGYEPEEVIGKTPFDFMLPDEAERAQRVISRIVEMRMPYFEMEDEILRRDGHPVILEIRGFALYDDAGIFQGYRGIARDITERKREQEERESLLAAVQRHNAELEAMISAIADGLIIYGPHLEIIRMNKTAEDMFGYTPEMKALPVEQRFKLTQMDTATGTPTSSPIHPVLRALAGESIHGQITTYVRPVDGRKSWTAISAAPIRSPDGKITGVISTLSDVTLLHDLQQQQEDVLHIISHDLRLPLTVIHGHMQLLESLLEESGIDGNVRVSCEAIDRSTQRMNAMIQDLADAARLSGAQLESGDYARRSCFLSDELV